MDQTQGETRHLPQITALKLSLAAAGFSVAELDDGRLRLGGLADEPIEPPTEAHLEFDDPYFEHEDADHPLALSDLMDGVALKVTAPNREQAQQVKHHLMVALHAAGFWVGKEPPIREWQKVVVP